MNKYSKYIGTKAILKEGGLILTLMSIDRDGFAKCKPFTMSYYKDDNYIFHVRDLYHLESFK